MDAPQRLVETDTGSMLLFFFSEAPPQRGGRRERQRAAGDPRAFLHVEEDKVELVLAPGERSPSPRTKENRGGKGGGLLLEGAIWVCQVTG